MGNKKTQKDYKKYLEGVIEFLNLIEEEFDSPTKPNFTTKDYTLYQYQCRLGRKIDELSPYKNRFLFSKKYKGQKNKSSKN